MLGWMLLAQVLVQRAPPPRTLGPILPAAARLAKACPQTDETDGDVVVCGRQDNEQYRLRPLGDPPNGKPLPPMSARLGNGTIDGRVQERCVGGFCAPAAMVTFKLPF